LISQEYRDNYGSVNKASKVVVDSKYKVRISNKIYVSAASMGSRQMNSKLAATNQDVVYLRKNTKSSGSGRKVKYQEQKDFIIQNVIERWETGNPLSKSGTYDMLISRFGHEPQDQRTEWELKMDIHSGNISAPFSQWLKRVLERHRFSIRKESISQTVPTNWLQICIQATALIRKWMLDARVTRLVNNIILKSHT
jgi:hypothetical protein